MIPAVLLTLLATPGSAPVTSVPQVKLLSCGTAELRMTNEVLPGPAAPLAPVSQTLTRRAGARQVRVALEPSHSVTVRGQRVQDRYVASWACVAGSHEARYALVGYACAVDPGNPGDCGGRKEWFRLLDRRGRFADAGVPGDGAARDQFYDRIGISAVMAGGVTMTPVIE